MGFGSSSMPGKGSDSAWFNICFPALPQPNSTKGGGKRRSPELAALSPGSSRPAPKLPHTPRCTGRGKAGRDVAEPAVLPSHPVPGPLGHPLLGSSLRATTGFSETSLPSSGVPENQPQWSYTSMRESKLAPWLFSFIVSCWWCNMTNLLGIIALHSSMPLSEIASPQAH